MEPGELIKQLTDMADGRTPVDGGTLREAADRIREFRALQEDLEKKLHAQERGLCFLQGPPKMQRFGKSSVFDYAFEVCGEYGELRETLRQIASRGWQLITVTQDGRGFYTVFYRRGCP